MYGKIHQNEEGLKHGVKLKTPLEVMICVMNIFQARDSICDGLHLQMKWHYVDMQP